MLVLFVCNGNTYRSRLAEVYLKSLQVPGINVKSAGVSANFNINGPITIYAKQIIEEKGLQKYSKPKWTQLSQKALDEADVVVFMNRDVYARAKNKGYKTPLRTFVWNIPDVESLTKPYVVKSSDIPHVCRMTFKKIIDHTHELVVLLKKPKNKELIDICRPDGTLLNKTATIDYVHQKGLWHRGVHAAIYTKDKHLVFSRRAESIIGNAGLWEFTTGGMVTAGEEPDDAIKREIKEELGIDVTIKPQKLFVYRYDHFLPHYGTHNRSLVHTYLVEVHADPIFKPQKSEVSDVQLLRYDDAKHLISLGRNHFGKMTNSHHYNQQLLRATKQKISASA